MSDYSDFIVRRLLSIAGLSWEYIAKLVGVEREDVKAEPGD
jgi:hypothetical protein